MIYIQIEPSLKVKSESHDFYSQLLRETAQQVLNFTDTDSKDEITIVLTTNQEIHKLNAQFLGHDYPTDVLSFPSDEIDIDTESNYLGDIIISYERAVEQAQQANHSLEDELKLLLVHGILHLLGFDHDDEERKKIMWEKQAKILDSFG